MDCLKPNAVLVIDPLTGERMTVYRDKLSSDGCFHSCNGHTYYPVDAWDIFINGSSQKGDKNAQQIQSNPQEEDHKNGEERHGEGNSDREKGSGEGNEVFYIEGNGPGI